LGETAFEFSDSCDQLAVDAGEEIHPLVQEAEI
jgi:hypothetical protein